MHGPEILVRYLEQPGPPDKYGNQWQYNSRSDRHSKVGSWGVALDLLSSSSLMRRHAVEGQIALGVNHAMIDFATGRKKNLDLVIARPESSGAVSGRTFASLVDEYAIQLNDLERGILHALPILPIAPVGAVLVALEAKACMTAHVKSLPRLYDELNSSHLCVHGASSRALAVAYVQVNNAVEFFSSVINSRPLSGTEPEISKHRQPSSTKRVIAKVAEIPRRSTSSETGFDGVAITVVDLRNDGSPVKLVSASPAPQPGTPFHYGSMIVRMANEYDTTFASI